MPSGVTVRDQQECRVLVTKSAGFSSGESHLITASPPLRRVGAWWPQRPGQAARPSVDARPARYQRDDWLHSERSGWTEVAACSAVNIAAARCRRREQPEHLSFLIWIGTDREELLRPGPWSRRSNGGRVWN